MIEQKHEMTLALECIHNIVGKMGHFWMIDTLHLIIIQIKMHPGSTAVHSDRAKTRTKHARQSFLGDLRVEVKRSEGLVNQPALKRSNQ